MQRLHLLLIVISFPPLYSVQAFKISENSNCDIQVTPKPKLERVGKGEKKFKDDWVVKYCRRQPIRFGISREVTHFLSHTFIREPTEHLSYLLQPLFLKSSPKQSLLQDQNINHHVAQQTQHLPRLLHLPRAFPPKINLGLPSNATNARLIPPLRILQAMPPPRKRSRSV